MKFGIFLALILWTITNWGQTVCIEKFSRNRLQQKNLFYDSAFEKKEIRRFNVKSLPSSVILENGYGKSKIKNPERWKPDYKRIEVTDVELVFTKYPLENNAWASSRLLAARLKELYHIDPRLNCQHIRYKLLIQTECQDDSMARSYFHGVVIRYKPVSRKKIPPKIMKPPMDSTQKTYDKQVLDFIMEQGGLKDSTVYKVFDRHPEWKKSLVVMDWTSSMYPYGSSAVLWHSLHYATSGIKYYTFFNDGDNKPEHQKTLGQAGGIYHSRAEDLAQVIRLFRYVMKKGSGGDIPENNMEAMIKAASEFPDFEEMILIADNNACIRDYILSDSIKWPLRIILCGTKNGINPMYLNLALKTQGSIHTIEEDIYSLRNFGIGDPVVNIGGVDFSKGPEGLYIRTDGKKEIECNKYYKPIKPKDRIAPRKAKPEPPPGKRGFFWWLKRSS